MGMNDTLEQLEAAREECIRLERENADLRAKLAPAEVARAPRADIREEARAELESIVRAEDERWDGSRSGWDFSTQVADAILAAGYRKVEVTEVTVEDVARPEPVIRESNFGPWYDFGFRASTMIVGSRLHGDFQPRRIMLPHQLYVRDVEAMLANGATEVFVTPLPGRDFYDNWTSVPTTERKAQ